MKVVPKGCLRQKLKVKSLKKLTAEDAENAEERLHILLKAPKGQAGLASLGDTEKRF